MKPINLKPVVSIYLDVRHPNKQKLFPLKLRATFQVLEKGKKKWVYKYYPLNRHISKSDYKTINSNPRTHKQKEIKNEIIEALAKANQILNSNTQVTAELFERLYRLSGNLTTAEAVFDLKISELKKDGRVGSADLYRATKNSVLRFSPGLTFYEITSEWIRKYVAWLKESKTGLTTASIYLRHLRAIYNIGIRLKVVKQDLYPFGRGGYVIKKTKARKIALSEEDKNRLLLISDPELRQAADFWILSYYCYGLNMTDIALLKIRDLQNDVLIIGREKTKHTDSDNELVIPIRPEVKEIILRWGNKSLNPNDYVFPILVEGLSPANVKNRIKKFTQKINEGLKKIEDKLELKVRLTTYTARHTFANVALKKGASTEFIQDALGHASVKTTQEYLSGFDIGAKKAISEKL